MNTSDMNANVEKRILSLVHKSTVLKGFRPETDNEIDAMLDGIGPSPMADDKVTRMLRKISGEEPLFPIETCSESIAEAACEEAMELAAMYKAQGKPIPEELAAKLKLMEEQAAKYKMDENSDLQNE